MVVRTLAPADLFTLLAIILALSTYLAAARFFLLGELKKAEKDSMQRKGLHIYLGVLVVPDAFMTISGMMLGIYLLFLKAPLWLLPCSIYLFVAASTLLFGFHIYAWLNSFGVIAWIRKKRNPASR